MMHRVQLPVYGGKGIYMLNKKCSDLLKNRYLPFIFLAVLMLILHIFVQYTGDDDYFRRAPAETGYFNLLYDRYFTWTSRIIIEGVLYIVVSSPIIVFRLLNVIFVIFLTVCITRLISPKLDSRTSWTVVLLFLIYYFIEMSSAGWAATSINYLWPAAAAAFSLISIFKIIRGEKIRGFEYPFYFASLIFAANQEQTAALLLGFGIVFTVFIAVRDKGIRMFLVFYNIIALGGIIIALICPGNSVRAVANTEFWFPQYSSFSIPYKLFLGISNALNYLFNRGNTYVFILALILLVIIMKRKTGMISKVLAAVIVLFCFLTNFARGYLKTLFPTFNKFISYIDLEKNPYSGMVSLIPLLVCCVVLGILFFEIYLVYGKSIKTGLLLLILCAGLAASVIIGFSPTVYASSHRVFLFLNIAFIAVITLIVNFEWNNFSLRLKQAFYAMLIVCGAGIYFGSIIKLLIL
ncbi:MAG: DUF6056 family protein [Lachnospiraceae bacterium]